MVGCHVVLRLAAHREGQPARSSTVAEHVLYSDLCVRPYPVGVLNIQAVSNIHVQLLLLRIGPCCFEFYSRVHTMYTC